MSRAKRVNERSSRPKCPETFRLIAAGIQNIDDIDKKLVFHFCDNACKYRYTAGLYQSSHAPEKRFSGKAF